MEWVNIPAGSIQSSSLAAVGYDAASGTLRVTFARSKKTYRYHGVPAAVFAQLQKCPPGESLGRLFDRIVKKGGYPFTPE